MPILLVGPHSPLYRSISQAMSAAGPGDTIQLESGYSNETASVTHSGMTVNGDASSTGIVLQLATGVALFTATGAAPIAILDAADHNSIVGNSGANVITVSGGVDAVDGGLGNDRLIVDYHLATGAVTGNSTSNFTEAGIGGRMVTITDGTIENFTVLTGSGADTITTGAGNDVIEAGDGANTITAGQGANFIIGGKDADTITALDGGNVIDGGDGTNVITSGGGDDTIVSGTGADTIVAGAGADQITVRGGADSVDAGPGTDRLVVDYSAMTTNVSGGVTGGNLSTGYVGHIADLVSNLVNFQGTENFTITTGSGNDLVTTGDGVDMLSGGAGSDTLDSGAGNDALRGGPGNDRLIGGTGADTAAYSGDRTDHTLTVHADGTSTMVDNRPGSPDGTDTVTGVERFLFDTGTPINIFAVPLPVNGISTSDFSSADLGTVLSPGARLAFVDGTQAVLLTDAILSVGPDTNEATLQRLYVGLLGRGSDTAGITNWDERLTAGVSKSVIATTFLNSPEYAALHGIQTDAQLVTSLYQGMLGRTPEPAGAAWWSGELAHGMSRGDLALSFADSAEAKTHLAATTTQIYVPDAAGTLAHKLYETGLGREVERAALPAFKAAFATETLSQIAASMAASPEFAADHGGQSNDAYIGSLYQSALGRLPEAGAVAFWTGQLNSGATRGDLLLSFATCSEAAAHLTYNLSA